MNRKRRLTTAGISKYLCFFRIRFTASFQYRAAALAGIATQFAWGGLMILLFRALYESNPEAFPLPFTSLSSYIWLQQSLLTLLAPWAYNTEIMDSIQNGTIAYELCRPADLYTMWFVRNVAERCAKVCMRGLPILIAAGFLPAPYGFSLPAGSIDFLLFVISVILGHIVVVALNILLFVTAFYTTSTQGARVLFHNVADFLFGGVIPLPFFPSAVLAVLNLLPFSAIQNTPFLLYTGYYPAGSAVWNICVQIVWIFILITGGRLWLEKAFCKITVMGG
jgi:ABC-2 type transport system permease protein